MSAILLDGTKIAAAIKAEVTAEVQGMSAAGVRPGLAVILVGHNPASEIYVRGKVKACEETGVLSEKHTPPDSITTQELLDLVHDLNSRDEIDGILVQLPLPRQIDVSRVLDAVSPAKDVDGFHPMNVGFLSTQRPGLVPCTPAGIIEILQRIWWRLDRALDEPAVRLSALVGGLDALLAGTTTVIDHHASPNFIDGSLDVIAAALGLALALLRRARSWIVAMPTAAVIEFIRDTPLLVQLYFLYFVLPRFGIVLPAFLTGAIALALYYYGLRRTPAMLASLGELAFPA